MVVLILVLEMGSAEQITDRTAVKTNGMDGSRS